MNQKTTALSHHRTMATPIGTNDCRAIGKPARLFDAARCTCSGGARGRCRARAPDAVRHAEPSARKGHADICLVGEREAAEVGGKARRHRQGGLHYS